MSDKVVEAHYTHLPFLAEAARQADINEVWALGAMTIADALAASYMISDYTKTWIINDRPAAIGGIRQDGRRQGVVWLLGTDLIEHHPRRFLVRAYLEFERAQKQFDVLYNYVDIRNTKTIRWLKWLGFQVHEPVPFGIFRKPFCKFEWRKE